MIFMQRIRASDFFDGGNGLGLIKSGVGGFGLFKESFKELAGWSSGDY